MTPPNRSQASSKVQNTLNVWAPMKASAGRPPSVVASSTNLVSSPMQTNASANHQVRSSVSALLVPFTMSAGSRKENNAEATTKPITNVGQRSQITEGLGRSPVV